MKQTNHSPSSFTTISALFNVFAGSLENNLRHLSLRKIVLGTLFLLLPVAEATRKRNASNAVTTTPAAPPKTFLPPLTVAFKPSATEISDQWWKKHLQEDKETIATSVIPTKKFEPLLLLRDKIIALSPSAIKITYNANDGKFNSFSDSYAVGTQEGRGQFEISILNLEGFLLHLDIARFIPSCDIAQLGQLTLTFDHLNPTTLTYNSNGPFVFTQLQPDIKLDLAIAQHPIIVETQTLYSTSYPDLITLSTTEPNVKLSMINDKKQLEIVFKSSTKAGSMGFNWRLSCPPRKVPIQLSYQNIADIQLSQHISSSYGARLSPLLQAYQINPLTNATYLLNLPQGWVTKKTTSELAIPGSFSWRATYATFNQSSLQFCPNQTNYVPQATATAMLLTTPYRPRSIQTTLQFDASYIANSSFQPPTVIWIGEPLHIPLITSWKHASRLSSTTNNSLLNARMIHTADKSALLQLQVTHPHPITNLPYQINVMDAKSGCPLQTRLPSDPHLPILGQISSYPTPQISNHSHPVAALYYDRGAQPFQNMSFSDDHPQFAEIMLRFIHIQAFYYDGTRYLYNETFPISKTVGNISRINHHLKAWNYYFSTANQTDSSGLPNNVHFYTDIAFDQQPLARISLLLGNNNLSNSPSSPTSQYSVSEWIKPFGDGHYDLCFYLPTVNLKSITFADRTYGEKSGPYQSILNYGGSRVSAVKHDNNHICIRFRMAFWDNFVVDYQFQYTLDPGKRIQQGYISLTNTHVGLLGNGSILTFFLCHFFFTVFTIASKTCFFPDIDIDNDAKLKLAHKEMKKLEYKLVKDAPQKYNRHPLFLSDSPNADPLVKALFNISWQFTTAMLLGPTLPDSSSIRDKNYQFNFQRQPIKTIYNYALNYLSHFEHNPKQVNSDSLTIAHACSYALSSRELTIPYLHALYEEFNSGKLFLTFIYNFIRLTYAHSPTNLQLIRKITAFANRKLTGLPATVTGRLPQHPLKVTLYNIQKSIPNRTQLPFINLLITACIAISNGLMLGTVFSARPSTMTVRSFMSQQSFFWALLPLLQVPFLLFSFYRDFIKRHLIEGITDKLSEKAVLQAVPAIITQAIEDSKALRKLYDDHSKIKLDLDAKSAPVFFKTLLNPTNTNHLIATTTTGNNNDTKEVTDGLLLLSSSRTGKASSSSSAFALPPNDTSPLLPSPRAAPPSDGVPSSYGSSA